MAIPQGILTEVWKHKLIFVETPDANETSIALENYRRVRLVDVFYTLAYPMLGLRQWSRRRSAVRCEGEGVRRD